MRSRGVTVCGTSAVYIQGLTFTPGRTPVGHRCWVAHIIRRDLHSKFPVLDLPKNVGLLAIDRRSPQNSARSSPWSLRCRSVSPISAKSYTVEIDAGSPKLFGKVCTVESLSSAGSTQHLHRCWIVHQVRCRLSCRVSGLDRPKVR